MNLKYLTGLVLSKKKNTKYTFECDAHGQENASIVVGQFVTMTDKFGTSSWS